MIFTANSDWDDSDIDGNRDSGSYNTRQVI